MTYISKKCSQELLKTTGICATALYLSLASFSSQISKLCDLHELSDISGGTHKHLLGKVSGKVNILAYCLGKDEPVCAFSIASSQTSRWRGHFYLHFHCISLPQQDSTINVTSSYSVSTCAWLNLVPRLSQIPRQ